LIQDIYSTNQCLDCRHDYQLLTFMTMDEFGVGRVVRQSLVETNSDWHMHKAIDHFESVHEETKLLRVMVVDKDLNEIRVLKGRFPDARVLICTFHVIKYLGEKCRKPEFGKQLEEDLKHIDAFVHSMVYAKSPERYDKPLEDLRGKYM
jgi:hypothetical protein